jgi:hypothetical protein
MLAELQSEGTSEASLLATFIREHVEEERVGV